MASAPLTLTRILPTGIIISPRSVFPSFLYFMNLGSGGQSSFDLCRKTRPNLAAYSTTVCLPGYPFPLLSFEFLTFHRAYPQVLPPQKEASVKHSFVSIIPFCRLYTYTGLIRASNSKYSGKHTCLFVLTIWSSLLPPHIRSCLWNRTTPKDNGP
jgi:hypothetical protein